MNNRFALWLLAAGLLIGTAGILKAQDATTATTDNGANATTTGTQSNNSDVRTLTGCLQKGDSTTEYELLGQDGSTWELRSDAVNLSRHIGETVTIRGAVEHPAMHGMKEDMKQEAQQHGTDKSAIEHGHMTVTNLNVVSNSCSR